MGVYGESDTTRDTRQPLLLGEQEIRYLCSEAEKLVDAAGGDPEKAAEVGKAWFRESKATCARCATAAACRGPVGGTATTRGCARGSRRSGAWPVRPRPG